LQLLLRALERLCGRDLTTAVVVVAFHRRRVLPLMARRQRMFEMTPDEPIDGIRLSTVTLSDEEVLHRVRETVEGRMKSGGLNPFPMCSSWGYLSLVSVHYYSPRGLLAPYTSSPAGDEGCASLPAARS